MSDLDLSAATEAAARARYERVRRVKLDHGAFESAVPAWDDAAPQIRDGWVAGVTEEIAAAASRIEAAVRERVAREIEDEAALRHDPAPLRTAARIARGGTS